MKIEGIKEIRNFWEKASSKRKRIYSSIFLLVIAILITSLGMLVPLNQEEAELINNNLNETLSSMHPETGMVQFIFGNNFMICLLMFIPVVGPLLGFIVLFNTGIVINAISIVQGYPAVIVSIALFLTPVAWIEYAAYSTALSESLWLFKRILKKRGRKELRIACIFIAICAILLLIGAIIETVIIGLNIK
ncbi:MAG: stage II sporulation protein M [Flavobacteriaceae bacterium]